MKENLKSNKSENSKANNVIKDKGETKEPARVQNDSQNAKKAFILTETKDYSIIRIVLDDNDDFDYLDFMIKRDIKSKDWIAIFLNGLSYPRIRASEKDKLISQLERRGTQLGVFSTEKEHRELKKIYEDYIKSTILKRG
jgi:hypothetical protein